MKRSFRFLAVLLCLVLLPLFHGCAQAPTDGLVYSPVEGESGVCAVSGIGTAEGGEIRVPQTAPNGDKVVAVADFAFFGNEAITSVVLPDSVREIGISAFADCPALATVTFGEGLSVIGEQAFAQDSALSSVVSCGREEDSRMALSFSTGDALRPYEYTVDLVRFPLSLTVIGDGAFRGCSAFSGILVLDGVGLSVGSCAFEQCAFSYVYVGASLSSVGTRAFYGMDFRCLVTGVREGAVPAGFAEGWNKKSASVFHDTVWGLPLDSDRTYSFRYVLEQLMAQ